MKRFETFGLDRKLCMTWKLLLFYVVVCLTWFCNNKIKVSMFDLDLLPWKLFCLNLSFGA